MQCLFQGSECEDLAVSLICPLCTQIQLSAEVSHQIKNGTQADVQHGGTILTQPITSQPMARQSLAPDRYAHQPRGSMMVIENMMSYDDPPPPYTPRDSCPAQNALKTLEDVSK